MNRFRSLYIAVLLAAVGCSGDDGGSSDTSLPATTTPATTGTFATDVTTTIASATTSTTDATTSSSTVRTTSSSVTAAPSTDDWRSIVEVLGGRRQDLYGAPDVGRIPEVCADQSQCFEQLNVQLGDLASKGWKVVDADPFTVLEARVEKFDGDSIETSLLVTVIAVVQRPENGGRIVDAQGATIAAVEAETKVGFNSEGRYILARVGPAEDPWRLASQELIREVPA